MIEGVNCDGMLPDELHPQLLARFVKYGSSVEQHLYLAEMRPGHFEYVLQDYLVAERHWSSLITIPLPTALEIAKELRKARTSPRRRSTR